MVVRLPFMSNFTDFDSLRAEPDLNVSLCETPPRKRPRAVIIPGSKNTIRDLQWLHASEWVRAIRAWNQEGTWAVGICGGYQMLGEVVVDTAGIEMPIGTFAAGVGLLAHNTELTERKVTRQTVGHVMAPGWGTVAVAGYEIHIGTTTTPDTKGSPFIQLDGHTDGWIEGHVLGTYLHGLFDNVAFRHHFIGLLGGQGKQMTSPLYDSLAIWEKVIIEHVDQDSLFSMVGL